MTRSGSGVTEEDRNKQLEDQLLRMKEEVAELKQDKNSLSEENRGMALHHQKVLDLVRGNKAAALEMIPAEFLTKDKGMEEYIKQLQAKVGDLKKSNRRFSESNEKLKSRVKTASRGTVPSRFLGDRKPHTETLRNKSAPRLTSSSSTSRSTSGPGRTTSSHETESTKPASLQAHSISSAHPLSRGDPSAASRMEIQQVNSPNWDNLSPLMGEKKSVSFGTTLGPATAATMSQSMGTVAAQPSSAQYVSSSHLEKPAAIHSPPVFPSYSGSHSAVVQGPHAHSQVETLIQQSDAALTNKSNVIYHLESLVIGLKEKLEASEALLMDMQDEVLQYKTERDEAVKTRDLLRRETDVLVEERDYAVRAKAKLDSDIIVLTDETNALKNERKRLTDDYENLTQRHRSERSRSDKLEHEKHGNFEELQQSLKEKSAALILLDRKGRESEQKIKVLHSTNVDMLQEMQKLSSHLNQQQILTKEKEGELEQMRLTNEGHESVVEQFHQLREEYILLQREHTASLDRVLSTKNITEDDARRQHSAEVSSLKQTISKWEAASKTQFKQYQITVLRLSDATQKAASLERELQDLQQQHTTLGAETQQLKNKIKLLFIYKQNTEGEEEALDEDKIAEIVMAMEIVERGKGIRSMSDMVKQFTGEEREDALVQLQQRNEALQRDLVVLNTSNKQLKVRLASAEDETKRQVSLAAVKLQEGEKILRNKNNEAQRVVKVQTERIENLKKNINSLVRYGDDLHNATAPSPGGVSTVPSIGSSLSLHSEVGPNDNILQISFRLLHFVSETVAKELFAPAGEKPPSVHCTLDFFDFETVATQEHFLQRSIKDEGYFLPYEVDFDAHFVYKITEGSDILDYLSQKRCALRLSRGGIAEDGPGIGEGLLSLAPLLSSEGKHFAGGKIALHTPTTQKGHVSAVVAYVDVVVKVKRPFSFTTVPRRAERFPIDDFALAEVDGMANIAREDADGVVPHIPRGIPLALLVSCQEKLAGITGVSLSITNVTLPYAMKCTVFTSFQQNDLWFSQIEGQPTQTPSFAIGDAGNEKVVICPVTATHILEALYEGALPLVLFDDSQADATDCVGSSSIATKGLLEGPPADASVRSPIVFVSASGESVGNAEVHLKWV